MKNVILREQLEVHPNAQPIQMGSGKILHLAEDRDGQGKIDIWFEPGLSALDRAPTMFRIIGTGQEFENGWDHVATVVMKDGMVWHVYREFVWQIG